MTGPAMAAETDPGRMQLLEEQIRDLQAVHTQLVTYAEDLNLDRKSVV